ncbi:MAG: WD40/YVTN/BNR-like repeat-containing protein [Saprospiraceae bacterium]
MFLYAIFLSLLSSFGTPNVPAPAIEPASLYISTDNGQSWNGFAKGLPSDLMVRDVLEHDGAIFLTAIKQGVYILDEGADTWRLSNTGLPIKLDSRAIPLANNLVAEFFPTSLAANGDQLIIGTFNNGAYHSNDGGKSWKQATTNIDDVVGSLLFTDDILIAGTHMGIWESKDRGVNWKLRCETGFRINAVSMHNGQLHVARQNGMGVLSGDNIDWSDMETGWAIIQLQKHDDDLYAITAKNEVFRTKSGKFWENNKFAIKGLPAKNLPEALWNGLNPQLPGETAAGLVTETSRGWIVGRTSGC